MEENRSIIAMKGAPFTRKTEIATFIATSLVCPLLCIENILDAIDPTTSSPQDLAFNIICNMAATHLSAKVSSNVVIDSPLSSQSQLDKLVKLVVESHVKLRIVIVECKSANVYSWQTKFEEYLDQNPSWTGKWYKAKHWEQVTKAIQDQDYVNTSNYGFIVSKLILDPIWDHLPKSGHRLFRSDCIPNHTQERKLEASSLVKAIKYMIAREESVDPNVVVYHQWRYSKDQNCRDHGHTITIYMEQVEEVADCTACGKQVKDAAYACKNCSLALHKGCAESFDKKMKWRVIEPSSSSMTTSYYFPSVFACASCKVYGKPFSEDCKCCLFETHLKCSRMSTVIRHDCEQHFLSIEFSFDDHNPEGRKCLACGDFVKEIFYSCKICGVCYHSTCLTEIRDRVDHEHGGHHHHLQLKLCSEEAEDYMCDECLEKRDPQLWFYSCEDCKYEVHLDCIFLDNYLPTPLDWGSCILYADSRK